MRQPPLLPVAALVALLLGALASFAHALDEAASRPVAELEIALKGMLQKGEEASFSQRYRDIFKTVAGTHDLEAMSRDRVGSGWDALDAAPRKALMDLLFKRVVAEYAMRLVGIDALSLTRGEAAEADGGGGLVALRERERTVLELRVDSREGGWRITDVRWGGAQTVTEERAESERVLASGGAEALIEAWKKKIPMPSSPASAPESPVPAGPPQDVVAYLQGEIIAIMKEAGRLGFRGRLERFEPLIDETHHLPAIAKLTISRPWRELSKGQRRRFVAKFRAFSIARYAGRFDGYSEERFELKGERDEGSARVVNSDLVKSNGERVHFAWLLREVGGRWKVLNIVVDGVSDLATKQAEYVEVFRTRGFDGLLLKVEEQTRLQETGG